MPTLPLVYREMIAQPAALRRIKSPVPTDARGAEEESDVQ